MNAKQFEEYIAQLYSDLGARNVAQDITLCGSQIDVYAEVPLWDGSYAKCAISCKHYKDPVGIASVREWEQFMSSLHRLNKADVGVIVSPIGFSREAKELAQIVGIKLMTVSQLQVAGADFPSYVEAVISDFNEEAVFSRKCYMPMRIIYDGRKSEIEFENALDDFIHRQNHNMFLLLGDYGAGKTTVCKHAFMHYAQEYLANKESSPAPIYISLRDYPKHLNLQSMITDRLLNEYRTRLTGFPAIKRLLREGRVLLFLDGFDEMVSRSDYSSTINNFRDIQSLLIGRAKVVLTCRTHYFKSQDELRNAYGGTELYRESVQSKYRIAFLQSFKKEEIKQYVRAVFGNGWEKYYSILKDTYNLEGIAERPILLDMITEVLPKLVNEKRQINAALLYEIYTGFWLMRDDWRTTLPAADRELFTITFAEAQYSADRSAFSWAEIEQHIRNRWRSHDDAALEKYANDIRTCSFILRIPQNDEYRFIHESFTEYFVSKYLYSAIITDLPEAYGKRRHTPEVLYFLAQHLWTDQVAERLRVWLQNSREENVICNCLALLGVWSKEIPDCKVSNMEIAMITWNGVTLQNLHFKSCEIFSFSVSSSKGKSLRIDDCTLHDIRCNQWQLLGLTFKECCLYQCQLHAISAPSVQLEDCSLGNVSFSACRFEKCNYYICEFTQTKWTCESLNGSIFEACKFKDCDDGIAEMIKSIPSTEWVQPPIYKNCNGLLPETIKMLKEHGCEIIVGRK
ncbi:MAG: NACHT domain-containing protein [Verrucomicrobia bacterium]|nr:NACHT domain-containing protein [Verrucomicrobiota bacterium]